MMYRVKEIVVNGPVMGGFMFLWLGVMLYVFFAMAVGVKVKISARFLGFVSLLGLGLL